MSHVQSYGIIPIFAAKAERRFLLVRHRQGHWGFPKGKPDKDGKETPLQTARRELQEETGIQRVDVQEQRSFSETYVFRKRSGRKVKKTVTYFVGHVDSDAVTIRPQELSEYAWLDAAETRRRLSFEEARELFDQVLDHLG
ncbi:MAG: NUDIX domain-containing protein [Phycisphaeraceae bacterium]|nr:NUDIX domain-containing protein [Phycisphaeraceae bacterium]